MDERAYHEAGHAVAAIALGTPVKRASLDRVTTWVRPGCERAQRNEAIIALAGPLAEDRYQSYSLNEQAALSGSVWRTDLDNALRRLRPADSLGLAVREARGLVRQNWTSIEVLAAALLDRKALTGDEINAVLGRGP